MSVGARSAVLQADETDHQREREARWRWIGVGTTVVGAQPPTAAPGLPPSGCWGRRPAGGWSAAANHGFAGALGAWLTQLIDPAALRWVLGLSFLAMAAWALIPDRLGDGPRRYERIGAFGTTLVAFFLVEMGDKTQIATVALAARYDAVLWVVIGTTLGMMIANVPAVLLGEAAATRLPARSIHAVAALLFAVMGLTILAGVDLLSTNRIVRFCST